MRSWRCRPNASAAATTAAISAPNNAPRENEGFAAASDCPIATACVSSTTGWRRASVTAAERPLPPRACGSSLPRAVEGSCSDGKYLTGSTAVAEPAWPGTWGPTRALRSFPSPGTKAEKRNGWQGRRVSSRHGRASASAWRQRSGRRRGALSLEGSRLSVFVSDNPARARWPATNRSNLAVIQQRRRGQSRVRGAHLASRPISSGCTVRATGMSGGPRTASERSASSRHDRALPKPKRLGCRAFLERRMGHSAGRTHPPPVTFRRYYIEADGSGRPVCRFRRSGSTWGGWRSARLGYRRPHGRHHRDARRGAPWRLDGRL